MIAYLILLHKDVDLVRMLLQTIYDRRNQYLLHVDRKAPEVIHRQVRELAASFESVDVMPSQLCNWAGWSITDIELRGIRHLLDKSSRWRFFVNLSGQDFPIKSQEEICTFLDRRRDSNFINWFDVERDHPEKLPGTRNYIVEIKSVIDPLKPLRKILGREHSIAISCNRNIRIPFIQRCYLDGATNYRGSQWFILTREFCEYVSDSPEADRFRRFYKHVTCSDEGFFQSVIMNSQFRTSVVNDNKRYLRMGPNHPETLTMRHLPDLIASPAFYARKFDLRADSTVIDRLCDHLSGSGRRVADHGS